MPGGQVVSSPVLGVIPCECIDEPYIAKN